MTSLARFSDFGVEVLSRVVFPVEMILLLSFLFFAIGLSSSDDGVAHEPCRHPEVVPFHPDIYQPLAAPPVDIIKNPDANYIHPYPRIFQRRTVLDRILTKPFVVVLPSQKFSAYYLSNGVNTIVKDSPVFSSHIQAENDDTIMVFNPLYKHDISAKVSNLTIQPQFSAEHLTRSTIVPWLTFDKEADKRTFLGSRTFNGRLYHFAVYGDEEWDSFPENSLFDWPRPFPFAYAPAPPAFPPAETTTKSSTEEEVTEVSTNSEIKQ